MSVLHQNEEVLGNPSLTPKRFPETREIPRVEFWWSTDILLIINQSTGMDQEIHPCGQGRIDSVKINPSLLRMREWHIFLPPLHLNINIERDPLINHNDALNNIFFPSQCFKLAL